MFAVDEGNTASIKLLVEHNADVNAEDKVRSVCVSGSVWSVMFGC